MYKALACCNLGNITRCKVLAKIVIVPGVNCVSVLEKFDEAKIAKAEKARRIVGKVPVKLYFSKKVVGRLL